MKYRISQVLSEKTLGASGTEVIDLDVSDPISKLVFEYKVTRGSVTNAGHVAGNISKIELVDGSDVLFSLSGKQMHALDYYDQAKSPYCYISNLVSVQEIIALGYNFGRHLWDPRFALDPKRFKNPQLKVTYSRTQNDASSSANTLKVLAMLFDEKQVTPEGFLMAKELKSYTAGAENSYEYTDMPLDYVLRKLLVEAYDDAYYPFQVANEIRLSEDNDKRVPIDEKISTLMKVINTLYPKYREAIYASLTTSAADFYVTPGYDIAIHAAAATQGGIADIESGNLHSPFALGSNGSYEHAGEVSGFNPHSVVPILFGDQSDPDDWFDVTKLGNLKCRVKSGSAGTAGAIALFTQQLRKY